MERYRNRQDAGQQLADHLQAYKNQSNVIVLALPRGGVPVAYEVAKSLNAPLDVFIVRKLGVPGQPELAMGALAPNNVVVFNDEIVHDLLISADDIQDVIAEEEVELQRREHAYRGNRPFPNMNNKTAILVDDGIATGATMRAAIEALRQMQAKKIVVAIPVAARDTCEKMQALVDELVCPLCPVHFYAVGAWYEDFTQTTDEQVYSLLQASRNSQG